MFSRHGATIWSLLRPRAGAVTRVDSGDEKRMMVMVEETTHQVQLLMFVHHNPEPQLVQVPEATAGVALIQTATVGRILVMHSFMNQHNGEIRTVMATVMKSMEHKGTHALKLQEHQPTMSMVASIRMATVIRI